MTLKLNQSPQKQFVLEHGFDPIAGVREPDNKYGSRLLGVFGQFYCIGVADRQVFPIAYFWEQLDESRNKLSPRTLIGLAKSPEDAVFLILADGELIYWRILSADDLPDRMGDDRDPVEQFLIYRELLEKMHGRRLTEEERETVSTLVTDAEPGIHRYIEQLMSPVQPSERKHFQVKVTYETRDLIWEKARQLRMTQQALVERCLINCMNHDVLPIEEKTEKDLGYSPISPRIKIDLINQFVDWCTSHGVDRATGFHYAIQLSLTDLGNEETKI